MSRADVKAVLASFWLLSASPAFADKPATPWAPKAISSDRFESHAAFDPLTGDLWFVRSAPDFTGWRLFVSSCGPKGWMEAHPSPISADGVEADPWFSPDGQTLWFISNRTTDGIRREATDIWRVTRDKAGKWGTPQRLPAPVNSDKYEWFPRMGADGWLYFGSGQEGGQGKTDIWRAHEEAPGNGSGWRIENLGPAINTAGNEYEPLLSADGHFMLINTDDGFYRSERTAAGWSPRVKLGPEINVNGTEVGGALSPSGNTLLFARDTKGKLSGEFFIARLGAREPWPPACPKAK